MTSTAEASRLPALGPPRDRRGRFANWSRTVVSPQVAWHEPSSEDQIAEIIARSAASGQRVRVAGSGHSFNSIAAPEGAAMTLDSWAGVVDQSEGTVTVRAGSRLRDINAYLLSQGLSLPIVGSITRQSIAGAIATGTHGSSLVHGNLASLVESMSIVTGTGEILNLAAGDPRLEGARVHLGALGVVSKVTLRTQPVCHLSETTERVPVDQVAARIEEIARSAEYVKVWWLPHTETALIFRYDRTDELATRRPKAETVRWIDERIIHRFLLPGMFAAHRVRPKLIPAFNRTIGRAYLHKNKRVGRSDQMLTTPYPARHRETEAAVPLAKGGAAFDRVTRLIDDARVHVNFIVELRFVRGDKGWMSPAEGGDTVQLGAYSAHSRDCDKYFSEFWRAMRPLGARPHWGKEMDHDVNEVRQLWPQTQKFLDLRDELDPHRVFANRFLDRVLGP